MKKLIIPILALVLGSSFSQSKAQANWELGLRFAENISVDATIPIASSPRIRPAVYLSDFGIATYFDWMFALDGGPTGLKFYPGVGPEFFFSDGFDFAVGGDFGVEYSFDFPLSIAIDWRPAISFVEGEFRANNFGFAARFRFGEGTRFYRTN